MHIINDTIDHRHRGIRPVLSDLLFLCGHWDTSAVGYCNWVKSYTDLWLVKPALQLSMMSFSSGRMLCVPGAAAVVQLHRKSWPNGWRGVASEREMVSAGAHSCYQRRRKVRSKSTLQSPGHPCQRQGQNCVSFFHFIILTLFFVNVCSHQLCMLIDIIFVLVTILQVPP